MVFELANKKILIISPQPFEGLLVSKQHYAIELAKRGNKVYFLEPPVHGQKEAVRMEALRTYPSIIVIKYRPFFNINLRFHFRKLFDILMKVQVTRILKAVDHDLDVVWSFDTNLYANLGWFRARTKIYHVVDPVKYKPQIMLGTTANIVIGVSQKILKSFSDITTPKHFINHGITGAYYKLAQELLTSGFPQKTNGVIRVGYIGNLLRGPFNYPVFQTIISRYPSVEFHFWGNDQVNQGSSPESISFVAFLKGRENVFLHGLKKPDDLVRSLPEMDAFLLAYVFVDGESDQSNSHKILEYLSTGKVVISSFVDTYKDLDPLICMTPEHFDDQLPALFERVIHRLDHYNSSQVQERRLQLALENNYVNHITKIENLISNL